MSLELGVAVIAVIVSMVSFEVNLRTAKAAERHGRMPVLIPQPLREAEVSKIRIRNIGNGPALNIVIATGTGELATQDIGISASRAASMAVCGVDTRIYNRSQRARSVAINGIGRRR